MTKAVKMRISHNDCSSSNNKHSCSLHHANVELATVHVNRSSPGNDVCVCTGTCQFIKEGKVGHSLILSLFKVRTHAPSMHTPQIGTTHHDVTGSHSTTLPGSVSWDNKLHAHNVHTSSVTNMVMFGLQRLLCCLCVRVSL